MRPRWATWIWATWTLGGEETGSDSQRKELGTTSPLGSDITDVVYPYDVINGKPAAQPAIYPAHPGDRIRPWLINASSATPFRVAYAGGTMKVVATDGYAVEPVRADALLMGMGERCDVDVTVPRAGTFPLVAVAEGTGRQAIAVLRAGRGTAPAPDARPAGLNGRPLRCTPLPMSPSRPADQTRPTRSLATGSMMAFDWGMTAPTKGEVALPVRQGERLRLVLTNTTTMWHPIQLHGHTFQVDTGSGVGPRKDDVIVAPKATTTVAFVADNPWPTSSTGVMSTLRLDDSSPVAAGRRCPSGRLHLPGFRRRLLDPATVRTVLPDQSLGVGSWPRAVRGRPRVRGRIWCWLRATAAT